MNLPQQTAIIFLAAEQGLFRVDEILRWADSVIVSMEQPPSWLIELSILNPLNIQDFVKILREHTEQKVPAFQKIQIIVLAWNAGRLSLKACLPKLFSILILEAKGYKSSSLDERLVNALIHWDCLELDVIPPELTVEFEMIFREYLKDAQNDGQEITHLLSWKLK